MKPREEAVTYYLQETTHVQKVVGSSLETIWEKSAQGEEITLHFTSDTGEHPCHEPWGLQGQ